MSGPRQANRCAPLTLLDHFLNAAGGVDFHGTQVVEPVDLGRLLAKLLTKRIAEIVGRIRADQQNALSNLGHLHGQGARRRRLAYTALSSAKDPLERLLIQHILDRRRQNVFHQRSRCHGWRGRHPSRCVSWTHIHGPGTCETARRHFWTARWPSLSWLPPPWRRPTPAEPSWCPVRRSI